MVSPNTLEILPPAEERGLRHVPLGPGAVLSERDEQVAAFPLQRLAARVKLTGPVASVEVIATFTNPYPDPIECTYIFPLSAGASVCRFRTQVAGRLLEGQIQEREVAVQTFEEAQNAGFLAALLEKERDNVFTITLGAIPPGQTVNVDLFYVELVHQQGADFQFRFPLVVAPRFIPGTPLPGPSQGAGFESDTDRVPDASRISPPVLAPGLTSGAQLAIQVHLESGPLTPVRVAASQAATYQRLQNGDLAIELAKQPLTDRDFVLSYRLAGERAPQSTLKMAAKHFLVNVYPPVNLPGGGLPRDLIVLMDISDNTQGRRLDVTKAMVGRILSSLGSGERFALVGFNHDLTGYKQGIFCGAEEVGQGVEWMQSLRPTGRADMQVLLERILTIQPEHGRALSVVLFTAGHVGNEPELYDLLVNTPTAIRFFTVGVDTSVNDAFLRRTAGFTRGVAWMLTPDDEYESIADRLVEDTRQPLLLDLQLVDQGLGYLPESLTPSTLFGLGTARPATILGLKTGAGGVEVRGRTFAGHPWAENLAPLPTTNVALGVAWAQQRVLEMQDELRLITGPRASRLRQNISELAREYRLLTEQTAFVLVDTQASQQAGQTRAVVQPSLLPADWIEEVEEEVAPGERPSLMLARRAAQAAAEEGEDEEGPRIRAGLVRSGMGGREAKISLKEATPGGPGLRPKSKILSAKPKLEGKPKLGLKGGTLSLNKPVLRRDRSVDSGSGGATLPRPGTEPPPRAAVAVEEEVDTFGASPEAEPPAPFPVDQPGGNGYHAPEPPPAPAPPPPPPPPPPPQAAMPGPAATGAPSGEPEANPEQTARDVLRSNAEFKTAIMDEIRVLFQALVRASQGQNDPQMPLYLQRVLQRLATVAQSSSMLREYYRVGVICHQALTGGDPQGTAKTQTWVQRFAALFKD